jgi:hypothetical protein
MIFRMLTNVDIYDDTLLDEPFFLRVFLTYGTPAVFEGEVTLREGRKTLDELERKYGALYDVVFVRSLK